LETNGAVPYIELFGGFAILAGWYVSIVVIPVNHYDGRRNVHRAGTLWLAR